MDILEYLEICDLTSNTDICESEVDELFDSCGKFTEKSFSGLEKIIIRDELFKCNNFEDSLDPCIIDFPNYSTQSASYEEKTFSVDLHHFTQIGAKQIAIRVPNLLPKGIKYRTKYIHGKGQHSEGDQKKIEPVLVDTFKSMKLTITEKEGSKIISNEPCSDV